MTTDHTDKSVRHWEKRDEESWKDFEFNQPYEKGLTQELILPKAKPGTQCVMWSLRLPSRQVLTPVFLKSAKGTLKNQERGPNLQN